MMFEILIKNQISKKFRFHPCIKTILWKPMRNKLSSIIFISNCYCMFPSKCNVHNEFIRCYSKHFSCLKFFSLFNITMKCSFSMTSNSKSRITFCWSFYRIFIFFYYFSKLTLFPSEQFFFLSINILTMVKSDEVIKTSKIISNFLLLFKSRA